MRHMTWLFEALDLPYDKAERKRVDAALRQELGIGEDAHCPEVWASVKALSDDERLALVPCLKERLGS
jgi:hypothetical protein